MNYWSVLNVSLPWVLKVIRQLMLIAWVCLLSSAARAELQFDVFLGFDGVTRGLAWFPVVCEIRNDSAPVTATIEVEPVFQPATERRRLQIELPTGTLKRVTLPVFAREQSSLGWNIRLRDSEGRILAEHLDIKARGQAGSQAVLIGSMARTSGGTPQLRRPRSDAPLNAVAEIQPSIFPDNPLALQGMTSFYLNSQRAGELKPVQVEALIRWLHNGGRIVVAFESAGDLVQAPWLGALLPCIPSTQTMLEVHPQIQSWLAASEWSATDRSGKESNPFDSLAKELQFERAALPVFGAEVKPGATVVLREGDIPLLVSIPHGKGEVLALLFSPEREPVKSWANLDAFWVRLMHVSPRSYLSDGHETFSWSTDAIFGALIETRQVQKMPLGLLMLLLVVYLAVIGPLDRRLVKRLNRPMLTWLTFPAYVVGFSALIYLIGYKLRAGESEFSQLHVIDVIPAGQGTEFHGQTYAAIYSPANQDYPLLVTNRTAALRNEAQAGWRVGNARERTQISQVGHGFVAKVQVPVWTSRLLVCEWTDSGTPAVSAAINRQGEQWRLRLANQTDRRMELRLGVEGRIYSLGDIGPRQVLTTNILRSQGMRVAEFVNSYRPSFQNAAMYRMRHFAGGEKKEKMEGSGVSVACSFLSQMNNNQSSTPFLSLSRLDLTSVIEPGRQAVLFVWDPQGDRIPRMNQFRPARFSENTLWRQLLPINGEPSEISKREGLPATTHF